MPFITTTPSKPARFRELLEVQDVEAYSKAEARRERNFKIRFSVCLVASVFVGSFLWAVVLF